MKAFVGQGVVLRAMRSSHSASRTVLRSSSFTCAAPARRAARRVSSRFVATTSAPSTLETQVREALNKLYNETPCMPIMVRLAWHDAGTFSAKDKTGGANASIRFSPEAGHGANAGLQIARDLLEPIKTQFPDISYADLYQLASVAGIKYSGGPDIPFRMGRKDATEQECTPDGRLPDADKGMGHLRDIFYRMGFNDAEITALSGAHTLGRCHEDRSGYDGPWTKQPVVFDNTYYIEILKDEPDPDLLRLESDLALLSQPDTKALCDKYASDKDAFFEDYTKAHVKLSELGCTF